MTDIELFDEREAARRLGLSVATLRRRRLLRQPPTFVKLGGRVLYRQSDLGTLIEENLVTARKVSPVSRPTGGQTEAN